MFLKQASKGANNWYLYVFTVLLVIIGYIIGQLPMTVVQLIQMNKNPELGSNTLEEFRTNPDFSLFYVDQNLGFFLLLFFFIFALLGLYIGVRYLHKRPFLTLITWTGKIDWRRIFWGFGLWLVLTMVTEGLFYLADPGNYEWRPPDASFLVLLLIAIFILPFQTSFEELFFRAYLLQGISWRTGNKWIAWILTSAFFTLVHTMNPEIAEYGLLNMLPYYSIAGLFLGYITIMDNRLELALGVHAATNFFGSIFVNYEGAALQTGSLFVTHSVKPLLLAVVFFILAGIFTLISHRYFKWEMPLRVFNP
jgi:membrane protease YdiL (CAAX protease family)